MDMCSELIKEIKLNNQSRVKDLFLEVNYENSSNNSNYVIALNLLLECDWHYFHEEIVTELQFLKDPLSIDVLVKTMNKKLKYLEFDESNELARKCTWALADIGTLGAKNSLIELSKSKDNLYSNYAQERIDSWEKEMPRKGKS